MKITNAQLADLKQRFADYAAMPEETRKADLEHEIKEWVWDAGLIEAMAEEVEKGRNIEILYNALLEKWNTAQIERAKHQQVLEDAKMFMKVAAGCESCGWADRFEPDEFAEILDALQTATNAEPWCKPPQESDAAIILRAMNQGWMHGAWSVSPGHTGMHLSAILTHPSGATVTVKKHDNQAPVFSCGMDRAFVLSHTQGEEQSNA